MPFEPVLASMRAACGVGACVEYVDPIRGRWHGKDAFGDANFRCKAGQGANITSAEAEWVF